MTQQQIEQAAREIIDYNLVDLGDLTSQRDLHRMLVEMGNRVLSHQWISVEEELPKEEFDDGYVFVFVRVEVDDETSYFDTDYIRDGKWELHTDKITHWMEIPTLEGGEG